MFDLLDPRVLRPAVAGVALFVLAPTHGPAQEAGRVTGRVASTIATGSATAVPGVTIRFPGLRLERVTDDEGRFAFPAVPAGLHELRAEVIGCALAARTVEVRGGAAVAVDFGLDRPVVQLPGLVVTGRAEGEPAYAVERLDSATLERRSGRSISDLIRGEFPGARIVQGSGMPGAEISIQFRGPGSISGGHPPLVVVDGTITAGGMIDLNPRDVEDIRVLKGSAAAAQYGSRGQAGVIEITTRGGAGAGPGPRGPLILVDGVLSTSGMAAVDPESVASMEMATGPAAGALFGAAGARTGVMRITTRGGSPDDRVGTRIDPCVAPPR